MMFYRPKIVENEAQVMTTRAKIGPTDEQDRKKKAVSVARKEENVSQQDMQRKIKIESGIVLKANGSCYLELGETKVLCSIHGPKAVKSSDFSEEGTLACFVRLAPFSQYDVQGLSNADAERLRIKTEKQLASAVQRATQSSVRLERFPKSTLEIHLLVLSDNGGVVSACVTCTSLALANSGVELFDLVPSVTVGLSHPFGSEKEGDIIVDPDAEMSKTCTSTMSLSYLPASETVSDMIVDGPLSFEQAGQVTKACFEQCINLHQVMKSHLIQTAIEKEKEREKENQS